MSLYVYAVGKSDDLELPPLQGIFDRPAYQLDAGSLCAVASDCPVGVVRAERRHIASAQRVLAALNAKFDLLPMAFGTISKSKDDLRRFLDDNRETLTTQLQLISGAIEMSLRVRLDVPDPIAYLVSRSPALQAARDRTFRGRRPPSHDAKLRLGQMFDNALAHYREVYTEQVMAVVGAACAAVISLPVRDEKEIANLAALVPRSSVDQFEAAVHASAAQVDEEIAFNIGGPWPPHNFVQFDPQTR